MVASSVLRLPVALLLVTASLLAGCAGEDDQPGPSGDGTQGTFASFEQADAAPGETKPAGPYRIKLIEPEAQAETGDQRVVVLLTQDGAPVEDAIVRLEAVMPEMGHGTIDGPDPAHEGHGVYVGSTDLSMAGQWELRFQVLSGERDTQPDLAVFAIEAA